MSATPKLTPMLEQYLSIKKEYPDTLLFYRMGDFYELFFEDAEIASQVLSISLTSRNPNAENYTPMCGMPHHAAQGYLNKLLENGYKVAICEQVEDPKEAKGLVKREVVQVLTPGTVIEDNNLVKKENNYLGALYWNEQKCVGAYAWLDFSTGEWLGLTSKKEPDLWQWVYKTAPKELLVETDVVLLPGFEDCGVYISRLPLSPYFDLKKSTTKVLDVTGASSLEVLDLEDKPELTIVCGTLLSYLQQTQLENSKHLEQLQIINLDDYLIVDEITERNLEIFIRIDGKKGKGTLVHTIDQTITSMGGRLLRTRLRQPWKNKKIIQDYQSVVHYFFDNSSLCLELQEKLKQIFDIERLSTRIFLSKAKPKDYVALKKSLEVLPEIEELLSRAEKCPKKLMDLRANWSNLIEVYSLLSSAFVETPANNVGDGAVFKKGFHKELDACVSLSEDGEKMAQEMLKEKQEKYGLSKLKLGYNRVTGYYFELSKLSTDTIPEDFVRRQTLVGSERNITEELKALEENILNASENRKNLETAILKEIQQEMAKNRSRFMYVSSLIAILDYWQGLAQVARLSDWIQPEVNDSLSLIIESARHPVVELACKGNYTPSDITCDEKRKLLLITGPNMSGKSTILRKVALITLLAQIGSFVPARRAVIGITDRIFSRVGASDNIAKGQSTFMVEMMETARILRHAQERSLVILDEIGRGTSTFDGLAIAWAVIEYLLLQKKGTRVFFATHYHELTALEGTLPGVRNFNIAVKESKGEIVFLYKLVPGSADKSYGIEVARLAGVPKTLVTRAKEILLELEKTAISTKHTEKVTEALLGKQSTLPGVNLNLQKNTVEIIYKDHPLLTDIEDLNIDTLSPMQALTFLHTWKNKLIETE